MRGAVMSEHGPDDLTMHGLAEQHDTKFLFDNWDKELAILRNLGLDKEAPAGVPLES